MLNNTVSSKVPSIYKPPSTIEKLVSNVKDKLDKNHGDLKIYLIVVIPILILLVYLVYKYNFTVRSSDVITNLNYKKTDTILEPIPQCYQVDIKQQYKLCDYYICSSFMTPCVGNQHYDYVSNDMITHAMQSGARYIQIPICEADISVQSLPVVATAVYGKPMITSLNTLEIKSVLKNIRNNAFKINGKANSYPLIVHLVLNTTNSFTLKVLSDNIQEILSDVLIEADKYKDFPIFLEKLCNLQGKIILFATPEYIGTKLEPYIVPTSKLFELYHFSELGELNMKHDDIFTNSYNQKLSSTSQEKSNQLFKKKYPTIDYILKNSNSIGKTILNDTNILNNLTCFNKVGMTVIKPQFPEDVISSNYETAESLFYGCQFVAMNFQINDTNIKDYLAIFTSTSFRLKPSSMRFSETEEPMSDMLSIYKNIIAKDDASSAFIQNDFLNLYSNSLIALESYKLLNTYITQIENSLKFNVGSNNNSTISKNKNIPKTPNTPNTPNKIGLNQCFIPRKSKISTSNNISIYLESASLPGHFITINGNGTNSSFTLNKLYSKTKDLYTQSFYIENPKIVDTDQNDKMISIRTVNDKPAPLYISFDNKQVKAISNSPQIDSQNNMTLVLHNIQFKYIIKIITLYNGSLKTMGGNIIGVLENNTNDGTAYYVIPKNPNNTMNFDMFKDQFVLQNKEKKTYITYDSNTFFLYDKAISPTQNSIFNIKLVNGYYTINNVNEQTLVFYNNNLIKFIEPDKLNTNENQFKIDISYDLD